ncbi:MAG TPA: hypothetical protein VGI39_31070 [Polyangiaceae bacterium]|jgi:hypothetical protein
MRYLLASIAALVLAACSHDRPPAQNPTSQTQTTSGTTTTTYSTEQPAYGPGDTEGWETPSGAATATPGSIYGTGSTMGESKARPVAPKAPAGDTSNGTVTDVPGAKPMPTWGHADAGIAPPDMMDHNR